MKLFEMVDWKLTILEQTWALSPFKKLLNKDKSKDKNKAIKEVTFVWFFCDIKSDYQYLINEDERTTEIKKDIGLPDKWKINKDIQDAIDFYNKRSTTVASKILKDSMYTANKLSTKMRELVDDDEQQLNGAAISRLINGIKQMPAVIKSLQETEEAVLKEIAQKSASTTNQRMGLFEDGFTIK